MAKIYPNLQENVGTFNDTADEDNPPRTLAWPNKNSNLEKNCNQIFSKGPAITRDIMEKVKKADIGPNTTYIMGKEFNTRRFWVNAGLLLLFFMSSGAAVAMWFTNAFDNAVFSHVAILPENSGYQMWIKPSPKPLFKVHIFNYTNVKEFERGEAQKLNVEELGPYVYEISLERINVNFSSDKVTYQEKRQYKFMPELSIGRKQNDKLIVPNIPLFGAAAVNKHSNFLTRLGLSGILNSLDAKPFLNLPAHRFIVGYEDSLYSLSKSVLKFQNQKPYEHFGLISSKIGVQDDVITINTGSKNIDKVAAIEKYNGKSELDFWSTDECNSFNTSTDGSMFSPRRVRNKQPVNFYAKEFCRPITMYYNRNVTILGNKIPAHRYTLPWSIFDEPSRSPANQCYCNLDSGECPPQGVFNVTPCTFGAPAYMSFPHFYNGDSSLLDGVTGLNRSINPDDIRTYADLHPTFGFVMAGKTRMQLNVRVVKSFGISQVNMFEDGLMLPVAWFDLTLEDQTLPEDVVGIIFQTTFTVKALELVLKFGSLLTALVTFVCILIIVKNRWLPRNRTSSIRPLQRPFDD